MYTKRNETRNALIVFSPLPGDLFHLTQIMPQLPLIYYALTFPEVPFIRAQNINNITLPRKETNKFFDMLAGLHREILCYRKSAQRVRCRRDLVPTPGFRKNVVKLHHVHQHGRP